MGVVWGHEEWTNLLTQAAEPSALVRLLSEIGYPIA